MEKWFNHPHITLNKKKLQNLVLKRNIYEI